MNFLIQILILGFTKVLVSSQIINEEELNVYGHIPDVIKNELNVEFSQQDQGDQQGYTGLYLLEPDCPDSPDSPDSNIFDLAHYMIGSKRYHSLICWLWNLKIALPDEHFKKGILSVVSVFVWNVRIGIRISVANDSF